MATGYLVTLGDGSLDPGDAISASQSTFDIASTIGNGEWTWTGVWQDDGQTYTDVTDTGVYYEGTDGNVYFIPNNWFTTSGTATVTSSPAYPAEAANNTVDGTAGDDIIDSTYTDNANEGPTAGDDLIVAGDGNDVVEADDGNDTIYGGTGNDTLLGQRGNDTVFGGTGADAVYGGGGNDSIAAEDGDDTVFAGSGDDNLTGGAGADDLYGGSGADTIDGGEGNDFVRGGSGDDLIIDTGGSTSNDTIFGEAGNDSINAGAGNDVVSGGSGSDTIDGGAGTDTIEGSAGDDSILGGDGDDVLIGDTDDVAVTGQESLNWSGFGVSGTDLNGAVVQSTGGMTVQVENTNDGNATSMVTSNLAQYTEAGEPFSPSSGLLLTGGSGPTSTTNITFDPNLDTGLSDEVENVVFRINDIDTSGWQDVVTVNAYDADGNAVTVTLTPAQVTGTEADDTVSGNTITAGNTSESAGDAAGSVLVEIPGPVHEIEIIYSNAGTSGQALWVTDVYFDTAAADATEAGNDTIDGGDGNDYIEGNAGDDSIFSGTGDDTVYAGAGNDNVGDFSTEDGNDTIFGGTGNDTLNGGNDDDQVYGGDGTDTLIGGAGNDTTYGGLGSDEIWITDDHEGETVFGGEDPDGSDVDTVSYFNFITSEGVTVTATGEETGTFDYDGTPASGTFSEIEAHSGTDFDDTFDMSADGSGVSVDANAGDDSIIGGAGDDVIEAGAGADTVNAGAGDDTIVLNRGAGSPDGDRDVVVLEDGFGNDVITEFDAPIPNGDGTFNGVDTFDVSTLTNADGNFVSTQDVTVTDDGSGNAVLTFPNGESVTLVGISPVAANDPEYLQAIGIPIRDGIVEGTAGNDTIDASYTGDPEGDMVDAGDAIVADDAADDDRIHAAAGDDTVVAGAGNDSIVAGAGDDSVSGGAGDDLIIGDMTGSNGAYFNTDSGDLVQYNPLTGQTEVIQSGLQAYGDIAQVPTGELYGVIFDSTDASDAGIYSIDPATGTETLVYDLADDGNAYASMASDSDGNLYLTIDGTGELLMFAPDGSGGFNAPTTVGTLPVGVKDIVFLDDGTAWVTANGLIYSYDVNPDGTFSNQVNLGQVNGQTDIFGLHLGDDGLVYATEGTGEVFSTDPSTLPLTWEQELGTDGVVFGATSITNDLATAGNDTLDGDAGDDTIYGGAGADVLDGGADNDTLYGGEDNDTLTGGTGTDSVFGGTGDDTVIVGENDGTGDVVEGGEDADGTDIDTLDLDESGSGQGVTVTFDGDESGSYDFDGTTGSGTFSEIEAIDGTDANDTLDASADTGGITLIGNAGDDTLTGGTGDDSMSGGTGDDVFNVAQDGGTDTIDGGADAGNGDVDTIDFSDTTGSDGVTITSGATETGTYTFPGDSAGGSFTEIENIEGTQQDDTIALTGSNGMTISGNGGEDVITGVSGATTVYGGDDNDTIIGEDNNSTGTSTLFGGAGNDSIDGADGDDVIFGGDGADTIEAGEERIFGDDDTVYGGAGDDIITSAETDGQSNDSLYGDEGNDTITVSGGDANLLDGGTGDDTLTSGTGADTLSGGDDQDSIYAGSNDTVDGGEGGTDFDVLYVSDVASIAYDPANSENGTVTFNDGSTLAFTNIEDVIIEDQDGTVSGTAGDDIIDTGYTGDPDGDMVDAGDAIIIGHDANDDLIEAGDGNDQIDGGLGVDTIYAGTGNDTVFGGPDTETNTIFGEAGNDTVFGGQGGDTIFGGADADNLDGEAGDDRIFGGDGNDQLIGDDGTDTLYGDAGDDTFYAGNDNDTVYGGDGNDLAYGADGDDTFELWLGNDTAYGGTGNDYIDGAQGDDELYGGAGNDTVLAGSDVGADTLFGGSGDDSLSAGAGDDTLYGGTGADNQFGASGDDIFVIEDDFGNDTITGSETGETTGDTLDGSGLTQNVTVTMTGDEAGTFTNGPDTGTFTQIEQIETGSGDDTFFGGNGADSISTNEGDDTLVVSDGDTADAGSGDDVITLVDTIGGPGATITIDGGSGDETTGDGGGDTLRLGDLADLQDVLANATDDGTGSFSGSITLDDGTILNFSEIENIICFTPRTRIATPLGLRNIEDMKVGDMVVTRDHGLQPIRWIEARTVPAVDRFAPVRIRSNVLAGQERDLLVSPQHRVLFQGYRAELLFGESEVLVSAKHLIDGMDVTQDEGEQVTYIHMLFDRHEVIYAEGAATESFHPGDIGFSAVSDAAREELFAIFPELRADQNHYGNTARRCLKAHEAKLIRT